eukprot:CAMPEP_0194226772 /NCGR_PEP_ID=MMETSP0156-20130528/42511_1 /TAXON_ID=33649 /ORGANISM="Thalassionema nitzschioides, Strain L26-B" /LENGTH=149 /DNA_ID=CAMNT_0038959229 /DNA_START=115 /DNA_END=564 /DNA_ORIENTATION=+
MLTILQLLIHFFFLICSTAAFTPHRIVPARRWEINVLLAVADSGVIEKQAIIPDFATRRDEKEQRNFGDTGEWEVRIFNDGINTREHIAFYLVRITGLSESCAYKTMMQAHEIGLAVVGQYPFETAEFYKDALCENGIKSVLVPPQPME